MTTCSSTGRTASGRRPSRWSWCSPRSLSSLPSIADATVTVPIRSTMSRRGSPPSQPNRLLIISPGASVPSPGRDRRRRDDRGDPRCTRGCRELPPVDLRPRPSAPRRASARGRSRPRHVHRAARPGTIECTRSSRRRRWRRRSPTSTVGTTGSRSASAPSTTSSSVPVSGPPCCSTCSSTSRTTPTCCARSETGWSPGGSVVVWVPAFELLDSRFDLALGHHRRYRLRPLVELVESCGYRCSDARYANSAGLGRAGSSEPRPLGKAPTAVTDLAVRPARVRAHAARRRANRPATGRPIAVRCRPQAAGRLSQRQAGSQSGRDQSRMWDGAHPDPRSVVAPLSRPCRGGPRSSPRRSPRSDLQRGDARLAVGGDALGDVALRPDEVGVRQQLGGTAAAASSFAPSGRGPGSRPPRPRSRSAGRWRCRSSCRGRPSRRRTARCAGGRGRALLLRLADEVLADRQHPAGGDLQRPERRVALGEAGLQLVAPHLLELLGDEHDRQPAVGDLAPWSRRSGP